MLFCFKSLATSLAIKQAQEKWEPSARLRVSTYLTFDFVYPTTDHRLSLRRQGPCANPNLPADAGPRDQVDHGHKFQKEMYRGRFRAPHGRQ